METSDERDRRWREQLRCSITVHRPTAALGEEVLAPILFRAGVLYGFRMALLTIPRNNELVLTDTGRYFGLSADGLQAYDDCYVLKWGYICSEVWQGANRVASECIRKGFPSQELNLVLVALIAGLPRAKFVLRQLEIGLRLALSRANVRFPFLGRGQSEYEYAEFRSNGDAVFNVYAEFRARLEQGRRAAVGVVRQMDEHRRRGIVRQVRERRNLLSRARNALHARQRRARHRLTRELADEPHARFRIVAQQRQHDLAKALQLHYDQANCQHFERQLQEETPRTNVRYVLTECLLRAALPSEMVAGALAEMHGEDSDEH